MRQVYRGVTTHHLAEIGSRQEHNGLIVIVVLVYSRFQKETARSRSLGGASVCFLQFVFIIIIDWIGSFQRPHVFQTDRGIPGGSKDGFPSYFRVLTIFASFGFHKVSFSGSASGRHVLFHARSVGWLLCDRAVNNAASTVVRR